MASWSGSCPALSSRLLSLSFGVTAIGWEVFFIPEALQKGPIVKQLLLLPVCLTLRVCVGGSLQLLPCGFHAHLYGSCMPIWVLNALCFRVAKSKCIGSLRL